MTTRCQQSPKSFISSKLEQMNPVSNIATADAHSGLLVPSLLDTDHCHYWSQLQVSESLQVESVGSVICMLVLERNHVCDEPKLVSKCRCWRCLESTSSTAKHNIIIPVLDPSILAHRQFPVSYKSHVSRSYSMQLGIWISAECQRSFGVIKAKDCQHRDLRSWNWFKTTQDQIEIRCKYQVMMIETQVVLMIGGLMMTRVNTSIGQYSALSTWHRVYMITRRSWHQSTWSLLGFACCNSYVMRPSDDPWDWWWWPRVMMRYLCWR